MGKLRVILVVLLSFAWAVSPAQTLEELRAQVRRDQEQLKATNVLLGSNQTRIQSSERNRKLVENNIWTHRSVIRNLDKQASIISAEIAATTQQIKALDRKLDGLKKDYGRFVYDSWKNHKMNNAVAFLFASRDFNDAQRRVSHMKRYNAMRAEKGAEIDSISFILNYEIEKLNLKKQELNQSKSLQNREMSELSKEEQQLASIISGLQKDRKKLEAQAREQKSRIDKAQKQIDRIIAEQARSGRSQAQREEDVILSGRFEDNKGLLPWPVSGGSVLHRFGRQKISALITNDYKGIEIATPRGASVRAVFEGEVTGTYELDRFNLAVTVRSGSYIVLYANLGRANVKTGDKVAINQQIGRLDDSEDDDRHMLIFQIWRETTPVDPEQWLR